jgi:hypothetical protein
MDDEVLARGARLPSARDCVENRLRHVEIRGRIAEFVCARRRKLDRAVARQHTIMATAARIGEFTEDRRKQALLVGAKRTR